MRAFRKNFRTITVPEWVKNQMDLVKGIARPPIKGYRVSYAELIIHLIRNYPDRQPVTLDWVESEKTFEDTTTESSVENNESDSTYVKTTSGSSFETVEDETEFKKDD